MRHEPEDFEPVFRSLYPRATGLARRVVGSSAVAEEVAAEAMARALLRWDRLDPELREGWILKVTGNLAIDHLRRQNRRNAGTAEATDPGDTVVDLRGIDGIGGAADRVALADALRRLPRRQREVVVLRCLGDFSEAEVAERLGIGVGSVKTHLHRGLGALRTRLEDGGNPVIDLTDATRPV